MGNEIQTLRKSVNALTEAVESMDEREIGRVIGIVNERYDRYVESLSKPYECRYFGEAKRIIDESLANMFTGNKKVMREFYNLLKNDGNLYTEYKFMNLLENYGLDGMSGEYLDECIGTLGMVDKGSVAESNEKIFEFVRKHGMKPSEEINEEDMSVYKACDAIIGDCRRSGDVGLYIESKNTVKEYLEENKKFSSKQMTCIDEEVAAYVEDNEINLSEDEKRVVGIINNGTDEEKKALYEELKGDCRGMIDEMARNCSDEEELEKVMSIKETFEGKTYENEGVDGIINLIRISESIG